MKKLLILAVTAVLLVTPVTFTGCTTPATTAYKVTSGTYTTVDAAMTAWGDYVRIYKPTAAQEQQVAQAYKAWQTASVTVIDTAKFAQSTDATTKARVTAAVAAASAALSGLINILSQFGINLAVQ